jgi:putative FmdB family regulatory protein
VPIYDYQCSKCHVITERIRPSTCEAIQCPACLEDCSSAPGLHVGIAYRMLSVPAGFRFPDMLALNRKRQRIKEPVYRFPDGHAESVH